MNRPIPSYELYGNLLSGSLLDAVHHETIKERSSKHDWTIRLHRHRQLAQIFLFRTAGVSFRLGDMEHTSSEPMILVILPGIPHGFLFSEDVEGDVLSVKLDQVPETVAARLELFGAATNPVFFERETQNFANVAALIDQISGVYHSVSDSRTELLLTLADLILLYLTADVRRKNTLSQVAVSGPKNRQNQRAEAFCELLEDNFSGSWMVADLSLIHI